jgi:hypothetical protein
VALFWILVGTLAVSAVIAIVIVRQRRARAQGRLAEVPGDVRRSTAATSMGIEREGREEKRGTGSLVLTDVVLAVAQWHPDRLIRIPRSAIVAVDTTREHLDKSMKSDLLRVRWSVDGNDDTIVFFVRDLDPWLTDLGGTRSPAE